MKLIVLGQTNDDRGAQLEVFTKDLLEHLGYQQITVNKITDGGELDVSGVHVTPMPLQPKKTTLIAECKAYQNTLNTTDWLKFLGKMHVAEADGDVVGCLVALSGVNGNVQGEYESLQKKRPNHVQLVESSTLIEYVGDLYGRLDLRAIQKQLLTTGKNYVSLDLVYYHRSVYWLVTYEHGQYTLLQRDGKSLDDPTRDLLKPMIEKSQSVNSYVDLEAEERVRTRRIVAKNIVLSVVMIANGRSTCEFALSNYGHVDAEGEITEDVLKAAAQSLSESGLIVIGADNAWSFPEAVATDMMLRRNVYIEYLTEVYTVAAVGCEWWDRHIDEQFLSYICKEIQLGLELDPDETAKAITLMRLSPSALAYAMKSDPIITKHREDKITNPLMVEHDHKHFIRSMFTSLAKDFHHDALVKYFYETRRVQTLQREQSIWLINRDNDELISGKVWEAQSIGELDVSVAKKPGHYIRMLTIQGFHEMKRKMAKKKAAVMVEPSAPTEVETGDPDAPSGPL
jgi:hypothetical protein